MSILIKYMKMPTSCEDCPLEYYDENYYGDESNHRCPLIYKGYTSNNRYEKRRDDCPLGPVPPHGRLIDADLIMDKLKESCRTVFGDDDDIPECSGLSIVADYIESAPTIIPAEESET